MGPSYEKTNLVSTSSILNFALVPSFFLVMNYSEMFTLMKWWTLKSLLIFLPQDVMRKVLAEMCSVWYSGNMLNQFKMLRHNWIINVFMSGHLKWCRYQSAHTAAQWVAELLWTVHDNTSMHHFSILYLCVIFFLSKSGYLSEINEIHGFLYYKGDMSHLHTTRMYQTFDCASDLGHDLNLYSVNWAINK